MHGCDKDSTDLELSMFSTSAIITTEQRRPELPSLEWKNWSTTYYGPVFCNPSSCLRESIVENDAGMTSSREEFTEADTSYSDDPAASLKPPAVASSFKEMKHINP